MTRITGLDSFDIRFPTSRALDGSDAMNPDPDYSAAHAILRTDQPGLEGHGLTFTIGRGNEICCRAIEALSDRVVGLELDWIREHPARFWRHVTGDSQLRWIGPDKGAMHLATAAVVNAVWDLWAKHEAKPLWHLVSEMSPAELVRCVDFRYITDCITPEEAVAAGFTFIKMKVGRDLDDDIRRLRIAREVIGPERRLLIDANQVWDVGQAIAWVQALSFADPWFIEEPTSPDDVEGHRAIRRAVAPIRVATGEMCQNRILFKQFIMRGAIDIVQLDSCRLGGVNEVLAVMLMAANDLPVCPHAGGVGLCEHVQHLSMIDYLSISGSLRDRTCEYVDHLHEHFVDPCVVRDAAYMAPEAPGYSTTMKPSSLEQFLRG